jgi:tetratricopeptide (TPR) repeat protein
MQRSYGYQELASVKAETGHLPEAIEALNRGIAEDTSQSNTAQQGEKLLARAYIDCKLRRFDQCIQDTHSGFTLSPTPEHAIIADTILGQAFATSSQQFARQIRFELGMISRSLSGAKYGKLATHLKLRTQGEMQLANGAPRIALQTLEKAAAQDAPAGNREYLARALVAVAAQEPSEKTKREFLRKAEAAYAVVALKPALIFCNVMNNPPGLHSDELDRYLWLAETLNDDSPQVRNAQLEYTEQLRHSPKSEIESISNSLRRGNQ